MLAKSSNRPKKTLEKAGLESAISCSGFPQNDVHCTSRGIMMEPADSHEHVCYHYITSPSQFGSRFLFFARYANNTRRRSDNLANQGYVNKIKSRRLEMKNRSFGEGAFCFSETSYLETYRYDFLKVHGAMRKK